MIQEFIEKNGLVFAFFVVGVLLLISEFISKKIIKSRIPTAAISILLGLILAYIGGSITHGQRGIADVKLFSGLGLLGGSMFRDFAIASTAMGASILLMKKSGLAGAVSLILGILISFLGGLVVAIAFGYKDAISITTIGAGACTYIVGPVTGAAIGASSEVIALSIATGVIKAVTVAICTPLLAKKIHLDNPTAAMVFGGLMGTNAGVMAGLAATDPKLVPYGAMTATFYTGLGCLLCPSILYMLVNYVF